MPNIKAQAHASRWAAFDWTRVLALAPPLAVVGLGWAAIGSAHPVAEAELLAAYGAGAGGRATSADPLLRALALSLCRADAGSWGQAWVEAFGMWLAMVAAMMLPCALPAWHHLLGRRDPRAAYSFLLGYGASWLPLGAGAAMLEVALRGLWPLGPEAPTAAILLGLAGLGRVAALHIARRDVGRVDAGGAARRDIGLRHGFAQGRRGLVRDGLPMLAMTASGAMGLTAMLALAAAMLGERRFPARAIDPVALALVALAMLTLASGSIAIPVAVG